MSLITLKPFILMILVSLEDIDIGVRRLANGKARDIEGYRE